MPPWPRAPRRSSRRGRAPAPRPPTGGGAARAKHASRTHTGRANRSTEGAGAKGGHRGARHRGSGRCTDAAFQAGPAHKSRLRRTDCDLRQPQGREDLRASELCAAVRGADHHRASGAAARDARVHGDGLFGRRHDLPLDRCLASRRAGEGNAQLEIREKIRETRQRQTQTAEAEARPIADPPPPETPQEALARIEIPQDVIDQISQLIVPGSSLVVSDQGLGPETGRGTDFIVITR